MGKGSGSDLFGISDRHQRSARRDGRRAQTRDVPVGARSATGGSLERCLDECEEPGDGQVAKSDRRRSGSDARARATRSSASKQGAGPRGRCREDGDGTVVSAWAAVVVARGSWLGRVEGRGVVVVADGKHDTRGPRADAMAMMTGRAEQAQLGAARGSGGCGDGDCLELDRRRKRREGRRSVKRNEAARGWASTARLRS